jgi:hypothetical protein
METILITIGVLFSLGYIIYFLLCSPKVDITDTSPKWGELE